jgi:glycosyltransferase involved in cell wall biosynthesis
MRILFATDHTYLPHRVGGAESSTHDLATTLQERGIDVVVLAAVPTSDLPSRILHRVFGHARLQFDTFMGYPVVRARHPVEVVDEILERFAPSAVVVTSGSYAPLSTAFLRRGVPTIAYLRDVELANLGGTLPREPHVGYISNSRFNAARLTAAAGIRPVVIPPLVRPDRVRTESSRSRVLFVNPVPEKGVELVFSLAKTRPDIAFDVVECWPLSRVAWDRLAARAQAISNISVHRAEIDPSRVYRHAKIVLVPSIWEESWGRVVTEAHCSGIPALASNRGGLPESVGPGGILVGHDAPLEHWRVALSEIWDDPARYSTFVAAARRYAGRPEIQPGSLIDRFVDFVKEHIAYCSSTALRTPRRSPASAPDPR